MTCGLFAALNAIRLALVDVAPLSNACSRDLFNAGVEHLHRKDALADAVTEGMGTKRRHALARHLARHASAANFEIVIERPEHAGWSIDDAFDWIHASITMRQPVLIAFIGRGLHHYTVVAGITPKTLRLFDSTNIGYVRREACSLKPNSYHQILLNGLLRIAIR